MVTIAQHFTAIGFAEGFAEALDEARTEVMLLRMQERFGPLDEEQLQLVMTAGPGGVDMMSFVLLNAAIRDDMAKCPDSS